MRFPIPAPAMLCLGVLAACTHPAQIHGPRVRPGVQTGYVLPIPTKAISAPNGAMRETVRVQPFTGYVTWSGRLDEGSTWKPGWLLGVHYSAIDVFPRGTAYFEVTNPTSPVALGAGVTVGHNVGQVYAMSGLVHGRSSVFAVARATTHAEPRETIDGTRRPLTSTSALGGGLEVPLVRSLSLRAVAEMTQGRRSLPGSGGEIRQWIVTMSLGWRPRAKPSPSGTAAPPQTESPPR